MTVTLIPEVMQDMADSAYRQQVYIVAETQMHVSPWLFDDEGWEKSRLKAAIELVCTGKVTEQASGWSVAGSATPYQIPRATLTCPCKAAQHGKSTICKHRVAVELFTRVQQAYPQPTLDLPPVTVDERLAQTPSISRDVAPGEEIAPMVDDPYIPEPAPAVAVLERPTPEPPHVTAAVSEGHALTTPATSSLDTRALLESMASWKEQRQILARYIQEQLKDGVDYYTLRIKGRETKPTLSKAGSEKFLAIFKMTATFQQDQATWTMLGSKEGVLCYTCTLLTRDGQVVGEGRGARTLAQDQGDINKAVKMAQKSAQIDAILRTGCLSDVFTQDINEPDEAPPAPPAKPATSSQDLRAQIWALIKQRAPDVTGREEAARWVVEHTKLELHPDNYAQIVAKLEGQGR